MSGLKINLRKSTIISGGHDAPSVVQIALDLGCSVGNLSLSYLGIPLGGYILDCAGWEPVVDLLRQGCLFGNPATTSL